MVAVQGSSQGNTPFSNDSSCIILYYIILYYIILYYIILYYIILYYIILYDMIYDVM